MNLVDVVILLVLGYGAVIGFVRGFFKQTVIFVGTILTVVLSFILKNPLSIILYENLPFFKFGGLTALNIIMYEALAFMICITVFSMVLSLIIKISSIIEKLLDLTIVFAIPSKILGLVVGLIQSIVILYVGLFIVSMPVFDLPLLSESKYASIVLDKTPVMSKVTSDALNTFNEISEFTKKEINIKDVDTTNSKIVEIMLKNDIVTVDSIKLLSEKEKIKLINLDELVNKYTKEEK